MDGIYLRRNWGGEYENVAVLVAIAVNKDGFREVLGAAEGMKEDKASWVSFFQWLRGRGLDGVKLIVGDKCMGMLEAVGEVFPDAKYQRCTVHFYRNVFSVVPKSKVKIVAKMLKAIHAQESKKASREKAKAVVDELRAMKLKEAAKKVEDGIEETLTYQDVELTEDSRMTLGEWLDRWLTDYKENTVRPGTLAGYRSCIENYIKPQLGGKQVSLVTSQDVQKLYRRLKENGRVREHPRFGSALSDTTINRLHAIFHQAMEDALHAHIIAKNPTVGATVPKASHAPKRVLTDRELDTFLDAVREDKIWGDFFYVELTTGLRRGEICGLMWQDFDARNGVLQVRRTLHNRKLGVDMLGKTKTRSGERTIVLPRSTAEILRRRKENAITQWIFPDPVRPELPLSPNCAYTHMKAILHKAGLPDIRFHDLRHTFATHAIASGVDAKTLSGILGHTNASFTLDTYTHVTPDMQKAASGIVGGFMEDLLGKGLRPWQRNGKAELAP